jgi:hypothetical protein
MRLLLEFFRKKSFNFGFTKYLKSIFKKLISVRANKLRDYELFGF